MLLTKPSQTWRDFEVVGEPFTQSLKGPENEDRVFVRKDGAGVIVVDGATSKTGILVHGHSDGWWAAQVAMEEFGVLPTDATVQDFVGKVHNNLRYMSRNHKSIHPHAVFAAYWAPRREIWLMGDCVAIEVSAAGMAATIHSEPVAPDFVSIAMRNAMFKRMRGKPYTRAQKEQLARDVVWPFIQDQLRYANMESDHPLAYGVLAETPTPERFIHAVPVDPDARGVILASDGFPILAGSKDYMLGKLREMRENNPHMLKHGDFPGAVKGFVDPETGDIRELYDDTTIVEIVFDKAPV